MPLITKKSIEDIRSRADIVALVGDYTNLSRSGNRWKGLSPFAAEKTPSFFVNPDEGFYYCFSTAQGGDIFKFLMVRENLTFGEAVERVAQRFGLPVEYENAGAGHGSERSMRGELFALHDFAASFFAEKFRAKTPVAERVRNYWRGERKFDDETAREFGIGFLPESGSRELVDALLKKGFSRLAIAGSGMFGGSDKNFDPRTKRVQFEARLIIPIRDIQGRVIAFTARKIPGITPDNEWEQAKYKNSSESEVFKKGATLFNIDKAKEVFTDVARKHGNAGAHADSRTIPFMLVEGQLDAIRSFQSGIKTVVAGQGTGITLQQMQLLARYSGGLDCLLDADAAGQKAALRLAPLAFEAGLELNFLSVPGGKDPDEFLANRGNAGVEEILATRLPAIDFIAARYFGVGKSLTLAQKQEALEEIYEIIAAAGSQVARSNYLMKLARWAGSEHLSLERDFRDFLNRKNFRRRELEGVPVSVRSAPAEANAPLTSLEEDVLLLALQYDAILSQLDADIPPEWIDADVMPGRILNRILAEFSEGGWKNAKESLRDLLDGDDEKSYIAKITANMRVFDEPERIAEQCLRRLCERFCSREREKIDAQIARLSPDDPAVLPLLRRRIELRNTLKNFRK